MSDAILAANGNDASSIQQPGPMGHEIQCERLVITDRYGNARIVLGCSADGKTAEITVVDGDGAARLLAYVRDGGAADVRTETSSGAAWASIGSDDSAEVADVMLSTEGQSGFSPSSFNLRCEPGEPASAFSEWGGVRQLMVGR
jgi:hypothetical protein